MQYLILLPLALAVMMFGLVAVAVVVFSFFTKSLIFRWVSVLSLFGYVVLVACGADRIFSEPEWNPEIKGDTEVVGVWADPHHQLQLTSDHHFTYQDHDTVTSGVWKRDDWNLYLKTDTSVPDDSSTLFRFIQYKGHLRVLTHDMGDPDGWDGDIGLPKKQ